MEFFMLPRDEQALNDNRTLLVKKLNISEVLFAKLQENYTLTEAIVDEIKALLTRQEKVAKLLYYLPKRGPNAFKTFIDALMETHQAQLAYLLDPSRNTMQNDDDMDSELSQSHESSLNLR